MAGLLARIVEFALIAWLGLLALVVAVRVLRGDIPLNGLLSAGDRGGIDPERVQSLLVVGFVFAGYVMALFDESGNPRSLPEVPTSLLVLLAGSNGVYLSGKIARGI